MAPGSQLQDYGKCDIDEHASLLQCDVIPGFKVFRGRKKSCTTDRVAPSVSKKQKFANKKKRFFFTFSGVSQ